MKASVTDRCKQSLRKRQQNHGMLLRSLMKIFDVLDKSWETVIRAEESHYFLSDHGQTAQGAEDDKDKEKEPTARRGFCVVIRD